MVSSLLSSLGGYGSPDSGPNSFEAPVGICSPHLLCPWSSANTTGLISKVLQTVFTSYAWQLLLRYLKHQAKSKTLGERSSNQRK